MNPMIRLEQTKWSQNFRHSFQNLMPKEKKILDLERGFFFLWAKNINHQNAWQAQDRCLPTGTVWPWGII